MKLESIVMMLPSHNAEWCSFDFKKDVLGSIGSLYSSKTIVKNKLFGDFESKSRPYLKSLDVLEENDTIEKVLGEYGDLTEEVLANEEMFSVSYLVYVNLGYDPNLFLDYYDIYPLDKNKLNGYVETLGSLDEVLKFLKDNEIKCAYHGEKQSDLLKYFINGVEQSVFFGDVDLACTHQKYEQRENEDIRTYTFGDGSVLRFSEYLETGEITFLDNG